MALTKIKLNEVDTKADPVLADGVLLSDSADGGRGKISTLTDLQTLIGGGGGGGAVDSVAGKTGVVTLDASDIAETAALKIMTADERTKLTGIAAGAEVNTVDSVAGKTGVVTLDADDVAPTSSKLWMSDTQSAKLTGIAENANNYTHPETHPQSMIEGLADALAAKAPLASPALTGTPTAPTAASGTDTTQIATTAFVQDAIADISIDADPYAVQLTGDQSISGIKTFTSSPVLPTPTAGDDTTKAATTEFVQDAVAGVTASSIGLGSVDNTSDSAKPVSTAQAAALALKAPLASPALTGTPTAPTAAVGTNTTQLATTAFVTGAVASKANDADVVKTTGNQSIGGTKTFTASPVLPTPAAGDNSNKGATTAFVTGALAARRPKHTYVPITTASTVIAAERGNTYGVNANSCTLTLPLAGTAGYVDGDEISVVVGVSATRELAIVSPSYILRGTGLQSLNTPFNVTGFGTFISFIRSSNVWVMSYPEYALDGKAPLASPALTGTPTAPTAAAGTNTTQLATTAFVQAATARAIYDLPVTRSGVVSDGTDVVLLETGVLDPAWYDETHVLNVSFFARNASGIGNSTTFRFQIYDTATSTAYTIASVIGDTSALRYMQASIYRASSTSVNCSAIYGNTQDSGLVTLASGSYKLRVVCNSSLSIVFSAAQVRFTK